MAVGGLLELQHELERFNGAFYASGHGVDLSRYVLPVCLAYSAFSLVPAFVAMAR